MKKIALLLMAVVLMAACHPVREKVVQTYPNGSKMLVYAYTGSEKNPTRVAEYMYYEDGTLQFEKHFSGKPEVPDGQWNYYFDNGQLFATADFTQHRDFGSGWQFFNRNGGPYYDGQLDSVFVNDLGMFGTPATVVFCSGIHQDVIQFYSNYTVRSTERLTNGARNGRVIFYFPNGNMQVDATYANGLKEGPYVVYYENGSPCYQGSCSHDKRVGEWQFFDEQGNLSYTRDFTNLVQ